MKKVALELVGLDGNAFSILGAFQRQARKEGWSQDEIKTVLDDAMSGDYNHLLVTMVKHIISPALRKEELKESLTWEKLPKDYGYWYGCGKYQKEYDQLWKQHIPSNGKAEGKYETLRVVSRLVHDLYNNGMDNWDVLCDSLTDLELDETLEQHRKAVLTILPNEDDTVKCYECGGEGQFEEESYDDETDESEYYYETCHYCNGSGSVNWRDGGFELEDFDQLAYILEKFMDSVIESLVLFITT